MNKQIIRILNTEREEQPYNIVYSGVSSINIPEYGFVSEQPLKNDYYIINPVGFTSTPDKDDLAYTFSTDNGNKFCIATDLLDKPDTKPNEVCLGNFKNKNYVRINDNQIKIEEEGTEQIYIKSSDTTSISTKNMLELVSEDTIKIKAPKILIEGNVKIDGNLEVVGQITCNNGVLVNGKKIDDKHMHAGVTSGSSNTGGLV